MQEYLERTRLGAAMDHLGGTAFIFAVSQMFFILLWGLRFSAVIAGLAAFAMLLILRERTRKRRLAHKETMLRRRIGGELKMEQWLVASPRRAHAENALLLAQTQEMDMVRVNDAGAFCVLKKTNEQLLIACAQLPDGDKLTARDVAAFQRLCLHERAERGVLCGAAGMASDARRQAELPPRVQVIAREKMIALAGAAWPATDEQLIRLGERKRHPVHRGKLPEIILQAERATRYLYYGLALCGLYFLLGSPFYLISGCVCLVLMALCRMGRKCKTSQDLL